MKKVVLKFIKILLRQEEKTMAILAYYMQNFAHAFFWFKIYSSLKSMWNFMNRSDFKNEQNDFFAFFWFAHDFWIHLLRTPQKFQPIYL